MKKIMTIIMACVALTNMGFSAEEIKDDIEIGSPNSTSAQFPTQSDLINNIELKITIIQFFYRFS